MWMVKHWPRPWPPSEGRNGHVGPYGSGEFFRKLSYSAILEHLARETHKWSDMMIKQVLYLIHVAKYGPPGLILGPFFTYFEKVHPRSLTLILCEKTVHKVPFKVNFFIQLSILMIHAKSWGQADINKEMADQDNLLLTDLYGPTWPFERLGTDEITWSQGWRWPVALIHIWIAINYHSF